MLKKLLARVWHLASGVLAAPGNKAGSKEYSDVSIAGIVPEGVGVGVGEGSDAATACRDMMMDRPGGSPLIGRPVPVPVSRHHSSAGRRWDVECGHNYFIQLFLGL